MLTAEEKTERQRLRDIWCVASGGTLHRLIELERKDAAGNRDNARELLPQAEFYAPDMPLIGKTDRGNYFCRMCFELSHDPRLIEHAGYCQRQEAAPDFDDEPTKERKR